MVSIERCLNFPRVSRHLFPFKWCAWYIEVLNLLWQVGSGRRAGHRSGVIFVPKGHAKQNPCYHLNNFGYASKFHCLASHKTRFSTCFCPELANSHSWFIKSLQFPWHHLANPTLKPKGHRKSRRDPLRVQQPLSLMGPLLLCHLIPKGSTHLPL